MKASDLLVRCLEVESIDYVFGVPGEENADLMMSLEESDHIRFILCRHEQGAAFMADAYGRLTGNPAVCLGTLGPGAANLVTGVADGNMDRAPLIVVTGQGDSRRLHKESHQIMDVVDMFRPITKWAQTIRHPNAIPEVVRKAVRLARTEKPGACHIELPEDIAALESNAAPIAPRRHRRAVPDQSILDRAWEVIRAARRPIILAGNGTIRRRASAELRRFVDQTGIGVVTTFMAKGAVDRDDPRCLYSIGLQSRDHASVAIDASDLVITVGYDMVEYPPRLWNAGASQHVVHLDFIPAEIDEHYQLEVEVIGDLAHTLRALTDRVVAGAGTFEYDHTHTRTARDRMTRDIEAYKDDEQRGTIKPQKAVWDVRQVLGPADILLSDVGAHKMWIARYYHCHEPNTCLIPNGFCSMGFALPGALAAHLVYPDRRVLAICGDGGFLMNAQEMETAVRLRSRIVVVVWEDHAYGLIAWKQDTHFGRHTDVSFGNPDFVQLGKAFGWSARRCDDSRRLRDTLEAALTEDGPSLVVVPIDYTENAKLTERLGNISCTI